MDLSLILINGQGQSVIAWVVAGLLIYGLVALDKLLSASAIGDAFPTVDSPYIPDDSPFIPAEKK